MMHKHHIVPKHMGGSNDPSNLILLTVEQHAEAHKILWEIHGCLEDKWAWLMLSNNSKSLNGIKRSEASKAKQANAIRGHKYYGGKRSKGYKLSEKAKQTIGDKNRGRKLPAVAEQNKNRVWSEESRKKMSESRKRYWAKKKQDGLSATF